MENFGGFGFSDMSKTVKKKRSILFRHPRNDAQSPTDCVDSSSLSSMPPSESGSKTSSDDNIGSGSNFRRKELNLNQCGSRASYANAAEAQISLINTESQISGRVSVTHSSEQSGVALEGQGNDNKPKKVKLKLGGVTRTIETKSGSDGATLGESSSLKSRRMLIQDNSDEDHFASLDKGSGLRGIPWKDFSKSGFSVRKLESSKGQMVEERLSMKQSDKYEPLRKSKRVPKIRLLDGALSDGDGDAEIRYLEKLKTSKVAAHYADEDEVGSKKYRKISSSVLNRHVDVNVEKYDSSRSAKESKRSRSGRISKDTDYVEEDELVTDGEPESKRKQKKEFLDVLVDSKREMTVTTRQRALQTGKYISSDAGATSVEFPEGLPPAPPRKQKEKLSEVEQQLKKAEAAQRRRMQNEKATRESEAEAIRKILGQDSSRKKREDKIKMRQEELSQERTASAMTLSSNTVRWVMGPSGTVVTFPDDMGLPSILETKGSSYPPPREKCAGPSCMNPYKYRDSKSKLPLCSLQCYKATRV